MEAQRDVSVEAQTEVVVEDVDGKLRDSRGMLKKFSRSKFQMNLLFWVGDTRLTLSV